MTYDDAYMKLVTHIMDCGMQMPIEWVRKNGDGSPFSQAMEMTIDAVKKQIPQHMIKAKKGSVMDTMFGDIKCCPRCMGLIESPNPNYCHHCGQALLEGKYAD